MNEFFAENNVCGQTILQLVCRGNAVIAELLRLKDYIPVIFKFESKQDVQKYSEIIFDFSYLKTAEAIEQKIERNEILRDLDEEFRDNHIEIINRFYLAFESIHTYVVDLNQFLDELDDGVYIHQSLESIFSDSEGCQVMSEALYLYGVMLLIVDAHIEGSIRERLLISYYRYTAQRRDTHSHIDEVCKLLRDTGNTSSKRPNNYPEDYFRRVYIKQKFVDVVIGRLRSDDIYNQLSLYPLPEHRTTAIANQAAMLYVCLFFSPNILHTQTALMRQIVDKYFPDNWVISLYMGFTINLIDSWEYFKAAKMALNNTLENVNVKSYANTYGKNTINLLKISDKLLKEGNLTNENVIEDINTITAVLRECNATIRWLMLHINLRNDKSKKSKQIRELVLIESKLTFEQLFKLLLNTAQLELTTKEIVKELLAQKDVKWEDLKRESCSRLLELSEVFGGAKPLTRIEKNLNLKKWFLEISKEVESLDQSSTNSGRKIVQLIQALGEVQEFHQLDKSMQVIQFLSETTKFLHSMIKNMNVKEDMLVMLQMIGDISYGWELIDSYTSIMQSGIKKEPMLCIKLRAIFLKLASALEIPLLRINQARSEDLISVSQYYSSELEIYARKVLQIIPEMMFENMAQIIQIQTSVLKELPTRLDKDKVKEYAKLNERFEFAKLTHSVYVYSEGMRMMKSTLVGVVCLDPKQLLEDGIRKELVQHISKALHTTLSFSARLKLDELEQRLKLLSQIMNGYKRSFEYIQDYVNINGLKIWQEEVTRIINYNVEQECNGFLRNKVHAWESLYQSRYVPIPHYPSTDFNSVNFVGRLARELIRLTDPKSSIYIEQTSTWYDAKTRKPILSKQEFALITSALEITGLVGLDRLFSFMIITNLQKVVGILENNSKNSAWNNIITGIAKELTSVENIPNLHKFCQNCVNRTTKLWPNLVDHILNVGQLQILRVMITFQLSKSCKFDAVDLESSLNLLNKALLNELQTDQNFELKETTLRTLSQYFDWAGMNNPFHKIYMTVKPTTDYGTPLFIFTIAHLQKMYIFKSINANKKSTDAFDAFPVIVAVHTILKQFHPSLNEQFIRLMCQFVMELTKQSVGVKNVEIPLEANLGMKFLEVYVTFLKSSHDYLLKHMPEEIMHVHNMITCKYGLNNIEMLAHAIPSKSVTDIQNAIGIYERAAIRSLKCDECSSEERKAPIDKWLKFLKETSNDVYAPKDVVTALKIVTMFETRTNSSCVDLTCCYEYLIDLMSGKAPKQLNEESMYFLMSSFSKFGKLVKFQNNHKEEEFLKNLQMPDIIQKTYLSKKGSIVNDPDLNLLKIPLNLLKLKNSTVD
ncbi:hypothetical protein FQR65_LT11143 [Abscondita terminalis]|nr:hypothetical protein FQR65_LT11143 [Abscondita terminalis]